MYFFQMLVTQVVSGDALDTQYWDDNTDPSYISVSANFVAFVLVLQ